MSETVETTTTGDATGGVYLLEHEHGYVKIGRSKNPVKRLATLETACPYDIKLVGVIETDDAARLESKLHDRYDGYRKSGEWFNLPNRVKMSLYRRINTRGHELNQKYHRSETTRRETILTYQGLIG